MLKFFEYKNFPFVIWLLCKFHFPHTIWAKSPIFPIFLACQFILMLETEYRILGYNLILWPVKKNKLDRRITIYTHHSTTVFKFLF